MTGEHRDPPRVDFELETFTVCLLRYADPAPELDPEASRRIFDEHVAYLFSLQPRGKLHAAGALTGHPSLNGLGFFTTGVEEAQRLLEQDPGVVAGVYAFDLVTLHAPKGAWLFPTPAQSR